MTLAAVMRMLTFSPGHDRAHLLRIVPIPMLRLSVGGPYDPFREHAHAMLRSGHARAHADSQAHAHGRAQVASYWR